MAERNLETSSILPLTTLQTSLSANDHGHADGQKKHLNEDDSKKKTTQKMKITSKLKTSSIMKTTQKMSTASTVLPEKIVDDFSP